MVILYRDIPYFRILKLTSFLKTTYLYIQFYANDK